MNEQETFKFEHRGCMLIVVATKLDNAWRRALVFSVGLGFPCAYRIGSIDRKSSLTERVYQGCRSDGRCRKSIGGDTGIRERQEPFRSIGRPACVWVVGD
jgi:hypothetical protein